MTANLKFSVTSQQGVQSWELGWAPECTYVQLNKCTLKEAQTPLPAQPATPGSARIQCCASVKYLHGVDSDGESRVIPVHLVFLGSLVLRGAVLMGRADPVHAQRDDEHEDAHTDDDNDRGHTGNNWDKGWEREWSYTCGTSHLNPTKYLVSF